MRRASCLVLAVLGCLSCMNSASVFAQGGAPAYFSDPQAQPGVVPGYGAPGYGAPAYGDPGLPPAAPPDIGPPPFDPNCPPEPWYAGAINEGPIGATRRVALVDAWYFRGEYLNWNTSKPANVLMGEKVQGNPDPSQPFLATDSGGNVLGIATVPTTNPFVLNGINGLRGTIGAELTYGGTVEISGFALENHKSAFSFSHHDLMDVGHLIATSTLVNGGIGNNLEFYNYSFEAVYQSQIWGGEANYFIDVDRTGFFQMQPLLGVRYINLRESMQQNGVFRDTFFATPIDTATQINSYTRNNLAGPQVGVRLEAKGKWFALGFEPKIGVMANSMTAEVETVHFRSNFDPTVDTRQHITGVSPVIDLGCYARINVSPSFSLRVGYNFLYLGRVTRPEDNIYYNDRGSFVPPISFIPPDVVVSATRHDIHTGGISVGGEVKF